MARGQDNQDEDREREPQAPPFASPFEDDEPQHAAEPEPSESEADDWQPPTREEWEAQQRDLREAQERERTANARDESNRRLLSDVLAGAGPAGRGSSTPASAEPAPAIDLTGMPDPVTNRDDFGRWLDRQIGSVQQAAQQYADRVRQQTQGASRADRLFDGFCALYPDMRKHRPMVEAAAVQAGLRGDEPDSVIFDRTAEVLRGLGVSLEAPQEHSRPQQQPQRRTSTGVGGPSGERPRRRRPAEPESRDFVDQLAEDQVKLGIM